MREALTIARCCMMLGIFDLPRSLLGMCTVKHILCCIVKFNQKLYRIHISATSIFIGHALALSYLFFFEIDVYDMYLSVKQ